MAKIRLTQASDGQTIEANVGDAIVIELTENPTTGFQWTAEPDGQGVVDLHHTSFGLAHGSKQPDSNMPILGQPGTRSFEFDVASPGHGRVELHCSRVWEGERAAIDRFSLDVVAHE